MCLDKSCDQMSPEHSYDDKEEEDCTNEEMRILRRREKNRIAAQKCRQKKRDASNNLVKEYQDLESSNTQLRYEIRQFEKQKQHLENLLSTHLVDCTRPPGSTSSSTPIPSTCSRTTPPSHTVSVPPQTQPGSHPNQGSVNSPVRSTFTERYHAKRQIRRETACKQSSEIRSSTKRSSSGQGVQPVDEGKKVRLPDPSGTMMTIPTPILSQAQESENSLTRASTSWTESSGQSYGQSVFPGMKAHGTTGQVATLTSADTGPAFGLGSSSKGWVPEKNIHNTTPRRHGQPSSYKATPSKTLSKQTTAIDSLLQTSVSQLTSGVRLPHLPSQTPGRAASRSVNAHLTQGQSNINLPCIQRSSEVASQVQGNPSGPLILQPPRCIHSMDFSTYTEPTSRSASQLSFTTSTLTSPSVSLSSVSSLPPPSSIDSHLAPLQVNTETHNRSRPRRDKTIDFNSGYTVQQ